MTEEALPLQEGALAKLFGIARRALDVRNVKEGRYVHLAIEAVKMQLEPSDASLIFHDATLS